MLGERFLVKQILSAGKKNGIGFTEGDGTVYSIALDPFGTVQCVIDKRLQNMSGTSQEFEVGRTDMGQIIPRDFSQSGHDSRGVRVEQHFKGNLPVDTEGIVVTVDANREDYIS